MKAQASVEYLVIIGLALAILMPIILYSNQNLISYKEDVKLSSAKSAVNKLAESANWVYSQGPPARLTVNICIPDGVEEISLNSILMFKVRTSAGVSDVYHETVPTLNGSIPTNSGCYFISLVAYNDYVKITVVE
jgi:uncharacterized protein (UPF0333 family)